LIGERICVPAEGEAFRNSRGIAVRFEAKRGKGSHGTLYFGSSRAILQDLKKELPAGTFHAMLQQLGLTMKDFE
jgi:mRNA interferase HicA